MSARPGHDRLWTPAQLSAIGAHGRTLVSAAAGSGKTSVLVERIVRSLLQDGDAEHRPPQTDPRGILAVTFTRKAAAEMRARVARELFEAGELDLLGQLELATIGTIHSLCGEILREHGAAIGIDPGYVLLEESQDAWYAQLALEEVIASPPSTDVSWLLGRIGSARAASKVAELRSVASRSLDGELRFPEDGSVVGNEARAISDRDAARATRATAQLWRAFETSFQARLERAGALTFDDLERHALRAVEQPGVATALRERWQLVAIDEFQDTNERQLRILDAVAHDRLFMVGDQWQSIYRFRGADVAVFQRELGSDETAKVFMLENFRSDAPVLDVVNGVFGHPALFGAGGYRPVVAGTPDQSAARGPAVELIAVAHEAADVASAQVEGDHRRDREARRVAERVADIIEWGAAAKDIVAVFESGWEIDRFERALRNLGVPTLRAASTGYYDQTDVRDVLDVLRAVRNPLDDLAVTSVLAGPLGARSYGALTELLADAGIRRGEHHRRRAQADRPSLLDAAASSSDEAIREAARLVGELAELERGSSVTHVIERIVGLPQFELAAAQRVDGVQRLANLRQLVVLAAEAGRVGVASVARFLDYVDAQRRFRKLGEASIADEASGAVRLMTIHASKGLEFEHVFYVKADAVLSSGGPPGSIPAPIVDEAGVVHVAVPSSDGPMRDTAALEQLRSLEQLQHHEERMRKAYVAMTRAKTRLYVSAPVDRGAIDAARSDALAAVGVGSAHEHVDAAHAPMQWIRTTLGAWNHAPDRLHDSGLVAIDGRAARGREPLGGDDARTVHAMRPALCDLDALGIAAPVDLAAGEGAPDPFALRTSLAASVLAARDRELRLADGTRLHDAMARLLEEAARGTVDQAGLLVADREPWLTERTVARLQPIVDTQVFSRLVALGARAEVPWLASFGASIASPASEGVRVVADARDVDAGRIDALAILPDGRWWVVDWKVSLDDAPADAWHEHGRQLTRYAVAARRAGAPGCVLTLA
ncbi:MAG: UvrD/REP helicase, partial [Thermoleophilia bacterium]|nr:UvrD/REP helicase [Thermoleophilia bacterium]